MWAPFKGAFLFAFIVEHILIMLFHHNFIFIIHLRLQIILMWLS